MDWRSTLIVFVISLAAFALSSWRASQPAQFGKVRLIPWTAISLITGVIALLMLVHALNLMGFKTGHSSGALR